MITKKEYLKALSIIVEYEKQNNYSIEFKNWLAKYFIIKPKVLIYKSIKNKTEFTAPQIRKFFIQGHKESPFNKNK